MFLFFEYHFSLQASIRFLVEVKYEEQNMEMDTAEPDEVRMT